MSKQIATSNQVMDIIESAFGLSKETVHVIIDLKVGTVARIIRVDLLTTDQAKAVVDALKSVNAEVI